MQQWKIKYNLSVPSANHVDPGVMCVQMELNFAWNCLGWEKTPGRFRSNLQFKVCLIPGGKKTTGILGLGLQHKHGFSLRKDRSSMSQY